jgi:hypothetical protein
MPEYVGEKLSFSTELMLQVVLIPSIYRNLFTRRLCTLLSLAAIDILDRQRQSVRINKM